LRRGFVVVVLAFVFVLLWASNQKDRLNLQKKLQKIFKRFFSWPQADESDNTRLSLWMLSCFFFPMGPLRRNWIIWGHLWKRKSSTVSPSPQNIFPLHMRAEDSFLVPQSIMQKCLVLRGKLSSSYQWRKLSNKDCKPASH
jgi:hypothetical protein